MKLKFGIMINNLNLSSWEKEVIDNLLESGKCELKLLIINEKKSCKRNSFFNRLHFLSYKVFSQFQTKVKALAKVDCSKEFQSIDEIKCSPIKKGRFIEYITEEDIKIIKEYKLDFIFRFGFNILKGDILQSAKYGIWSYHHGDEQKYRGGPAGLWEIYHNDPVTGVILQKLTDELDRGIVLKKGYYKTINYSYKKQIDQVYLKPTQYPLSIVNKILINQTDGLFSSSSNSKAPIYKVPHNRKTILLALKLFRNFLIKEYKTFFQSENWKLAYKRENELIIKDNIRKSSFSADVFPIINDDIQYLFYEEYDYKTAKGEIHFCKFIDKKFDTPEKAIIEDFHLSYPQVFKLKDNIYCLPEMSASGEQWIYIAKTFPTKWTKHIKIADHPLVDPTLYNDDNIWFLFYTDPNKDPDAHLCIKFADDLDGLWTDHPQNPVKVDIAGSRPAGNLFLKNENLIRPAQNSKNHYGQNITLNKITKINKKEYQEITLESMTLPRDSIGMHTLNDHYIDLKNYSFQFSHFKRAFKRFL